MPDDSAIKSVADLKGKKIGLKDAFNAITPADDAVRTVQSITTTAPPGSPTTGDRYIVPAGATGAWSCDCLARSCARRSR